MILIILLITQVASKPQTYQTCTSALDAEQCPFQQKCCDSNYKCSDNSENCLIYMNGHCELIESTCAYCCIETETIHRCGEFKECSSLLTLICLSLVGIYVGLLLIFMGIAFYKKKIVQKLMNKIKLQSAVYDSNQRRQPI